MASGATGRRDVEVRDEDIVISEHYEGDIEGRRVLVRKDASLVGNVRAEVVIVEGRMRGVVRPLRGSTRSSLTVATSGRFEGEAHVVSVSVDGRAKGILHAFDVRIGRTADVSGGILADSFVSHPEARCKTVTFIGPGMAGPESKGLLDGVRAIVDMTFVKAPLEVRSAKLEAIEAPAPVAPALLIPVVQPQSAVVVESAVSTGQSDSALADADDTVEIDLSDLEAAMDEFRSVQVVEPSVVPAAAPDPVVERVVPEKPTPVEEKSPSVAVRDVRFPFLVG